MMTIARMTKMSMIVILRSYDLTQSACRLGPWVLRPRRRCRDDSDDDDDGDDGDNDDDDDVDVNVDVDVHVDDEDDDDDRGGDNDDAVVDHVVDDAVDDADGGDYDGWAHFFHDLGCKPGLVRQHLNHSLAYQPQFY